MLNRVKIEIMGTQYTVASPEDERYVVNLAEEMNEAIKQLMDSNTKLSLNSALVLCALSYADTLKKSEESADHIRAQLSDYLEDCAKARMEADDYRRENEKLHRQLASR